MKLRQAEKIIKNKRPTTRAKWVKAKWVYLRHLRRGLPRWRFMTAAEM